MFFRNRDLEGKRIRKDQYLNLTPHLAMHFTSFPPCAITMVVGKCSKGCLLWMHYIKNLFLEKSSDHLHIIFFWYYLTYYFPQFDLSLFELLFPPVWLRVLVNY